MLLKIPVSLHLDNHMLRCGFLLPGRGTARHRSRKISDASTARPERISGVRRLWVWIGL